MKARDFTAELKALVTPLATDEAKAETAVKIAARLPEGETKDIPVDWLKESALNVRKTFAGLEELAASMRAMGPLVRLVVRPIAEFNPDESVVRYEIVAGHRRFRAAKLAELETLPCDVRDLTDAQVFETQVAENLKRDDLNVIEEAELYDALARVHGYTVDAIASKTGQSTRTVHSRLSLIALSTEARTAVLEGRVPESAAVNFAALGRHEVQAKALKAIKAQWRGDERPTARWVIDFLQREFTHSLKNAPFSLKDDSLTDAPACTVCPRNVANMPVGLFEVSGAVSKNLCTDVPCFKQKALATWKRTVEKSKAAGADVLTVDEGGELFRHGPMLGHGSSFVALDEPNYADAQRRTWRQLLERVEDPPRITVAPDRDLRAHELVDRKAATRALAGAGVKWAKAEVEAKTTKRKETSEAVEAKAAGKIREAVMGDLAIRLADRITEKGPTRDDWKLIADYFDADGVSDHVLRTLGLERAQFDRQFKRAEPAFILRVVFACVVLGSPMGFEAASEFTDEGRALAKRLGVNLKDLVTARELAAAKK